MQDTYRPHKSDRYSVNSPSRMMARRQLSYDDTSVNYSTFCSDETDLRILFQRAAPVLENSGHLKTIKLFLELTANGKFAMDNISLFFILSYFFTTTNIHAART